MIALCCGLAVGLVVGWPGGVVAALAVALTHHPRTPIWAPLLAIGAVFVGLIVQGTLLEPLVALGLVGLLVFLRAGGRRPDTDLLLAGLLLVVVATQTRSPAFALAFGAWVFAVPRAFGLPRWIVAALLVVAAPLFLLTPRFVPADLREPDANGLTGFSDDVELGGMQDLLDDPSRVFEATFDRPLDEPPYFRGVALDRFDGRRWWTEAERVREPAYDGALLDAVRVEVLLEAHPEGVLFVPGTVDGLDADGLAIERDAGGAYHLPGPPRTVAYTAWVRPPFGPGRGDPYRDAEPRLDVPELSSEVRERLLEVVADVSGPDARMRALEGWLREEYAYTRAPRDQDVEAPLERFLLTTREGHCEYFASALAVGGRLAGVPTRVVNGFVGGEQAGPNTVVVRRYHAHSWVEYFDGDRWVTIDATPTLLAPAGPGWLTRGTERLEATWDQLVGYDGEQQVQTATRLAEVVVPEASPVVAVAIGGAVIGGFLVGGIVVVRRIVVRVARPVAEEVVVDPVSAVLQEAWDVLEERGWGVPAHLPDVAAAEWVGAREAGLGGLLVELAWLAYDVRFGGRDVEPRLARARELLLLVRDAA